MIWCQNQTSQDSAANETQQLLQSHERRIATLEEHIQQILAFQERFAALEVLALKPSQAESPVAASASDEKHGRALSRRFVPASTNTCANPSEEIAAKDEKLAQEWDDQHETGDQEKFVCNGTAQPSFHRAVVHFSLKRNTPLWTRMTWLSVGVAIVLVQLICTCGLLARSWGTMCIRNSDCNEHQFCNRGMTCRWCGEAPLILGSSNASEFCSGEPENGDACEEDGCFNPEEYGTEWDPTLWYVLLERNLDRMQWFDHLSLFFAGFVVSLEVAGEARDIAVCNRAQRGSISCGPRLALWLLSSLRQHAFLPILVFTVPNLVFYLSMSAGTLDIFFNTLAVLFMLQVDDALFANMYLTKQTREELESSELLRMDHASWVAVESTARAYRVLVTAVPVIYIAGQSLLPNAPYKDFVILGATVFLLSLPAVYTVPRAEYCRWWLLPASFGILVAVTVPTLLHADYSFEIYTI